ncbi:MAG: EthD family reductase [Gammaproteobacteria bacterium]|nr:EthD family reductase [Gammaproteobacteria bacterium]
MINAVTLLKRKPGLSVEEFQRYWRHEHAGVIARLPGVQRYVQSHPLDESYADREPLYDGFAELWARDSQAFRNIAASEAYAAVQADEEKFLDRKANALVLTDEYFIKRGTVAANAVKRIRFFSRRPDLPVEKFQAYWRDAYGPLMVTLPSLDRYAQYHARLGGYAHGRQPAYDGFDISWFESTEVLRGAMDSPVCARCHEDEKDFLANDGGPDLLAREFVMLG